ncbi:MAG TPA: SoxR reducing system RseC family protein, partial [Woeseiaceae bacterium]
TYAYGLPLLIMMVALGLGSTLAGPLDEVTAILLAGAGLATGMAISRWRLADACMNAYTPEICAVSRAHNGVGS